MMRRICTATDAAYREIETDVSVASRDSGGECDMGSESCGGYRITGDTFTETDVQFSPGCSIFSFTKEPENVVVECCTRQGQEYFPTNISM